MTEEVCRNHSHVDFIVESISRGMQSLIRRGILHGMVAEFIDSSTDIDMASCYFLPLSYLQFCALSMCLQRAHTSLAASLPLPWFMEGRLTFEQYHTVRLSSGDISYVAPELRPYLDRQFIAAKQFWYRHSRHNRCYYFISNRSANRIGYTLDSTQTVLFRVVNLVLMFLFYSPHDAVLPWVSRAFFHNLQLGSLAFSLSRYAFMYAAPGCFGLKHYIRRVLRIKIQISFLFVLPCRHDPGIADDRTLSCVRCMKHARVIHQNGELWTLMVFRLRCRAPQNLFEATRQLQTLESDIRLVD